MEKKQDKPVRGKKIPTGLKQIVWCVAIYLGINSLLALTLALHDEFPIFMDMFLHLLANDIPDDICLIAKAVKTISDIIIVAILGGYIFSLIMSLHIGIVIQDNLILRRSPQGNDKGRPVLSFMVGNKSKFFRFDISCEITCVFQKEPDKDDVHTQMIECQSVSVINNFYRFSFDAIKIPAKFWDNYCNYYKECKKCANSNTYKYNDNHIAVLLSGSSNFLGGRFSIVKEYPFSKIVFNDEVPVNGANGFRKNNKKIDWDKFRAWPCKACSDRGESKCQNRNAVICHKMKNKCERFLEQLTERDNDYVRSEN